jgi:ABC-2 type transport system ATP-binding protein
MRRVISADSPAVVVRDLRMTYGSLEAVRGVDFEVARGEVFGLLGPNGAGKTSTVEILEGYRQRTSGEASVLGHDPGAATSELRSQIGIVLQTSGVWRYIKVGEAIEHWARLSKHPRDPMETLALVGLSGTEDQLVRKLSGGQLRRLDFALAVVGDPELIFLDEPTTGFDPAARRQAWDAIRSLRDLGKTVLITTHYLDEAQELCDRVAIIQHGKIVAIGPPSELGSADARYVVRWRTEAMGDHAPLHERQVDDPTQLVHDLTTAALSGEPGARLTSLTVTRPSLEDVYLELTQETPES